MKTTNQQRDPIGGTQMTKWQPIETAPLDGTVFIAAVKYTNVDETTGWDIHIIACDDKTGEIWPTMDGGWLMRDYDFWMPLPELPSD